uniref:Serpin domain-containing protein n=1 Tax=Equus asinus asinus TaxID=83772 RepID=A0A8C4L329_EQUAS
MNSLSEANTHFALDLFQQFKKSKKDNIFYSPLSITSALAMTYSGAQGNTALQIGQVDVSFLYICLIRLISLLASVQMFTDLALSIANRLYGEKTLADPHGKHVTTKPVQMMKQTNSFNFTELKDMQAKILEIPYKHKDLSMMLLLPNEVDGLKKLEDKLTAEKLIEWTSSQNMRERFVDLYLPRFKVEESYDLKDTMMSLGMLDAFSPQDADFSGMTGSRSLVVSKILHKSFVEVNEEGTEAAAATGIEFGLLSPRAYSFHCDHPFLFFIKHNKTNSILFLGRVSSP